MDDNLRKRLTALKATATGRGTTEAEAMAAAEKMAKIMREHGFCDDDVEYAEAEAPLKTRRPTARTPLWGVIAVCTNCAATLKSEWTPCVLYVGKAPGPEIATYLTVVCDRAIDRGVSDFQKTAEYKRRRTLATRRKATEDFTIGMVNRLAARLVEMFNDSIDVDTRLEASRVRDTRIETRSVNIRKRSVRFGDAAAAGHKTGQNVTLSHGVNGGKPVRQLGGT